MAGMEVRNNLDLHLAKFKSNSINSTSKPGERRPFTFKRLSHGEPAERNKEQPPLSRKSLDNCCLPVSRRASDNPKPIAQVAPVCSRPPNSPASFSNHPCKTSSTPVTLSGRIDWNHPKTANTVEESPSSLRGSEKSQVHTSGTGMEESLTDITEKRIRVMDEICEVLNEIPAAVISSLFGATAGYIQKKLAMRKKLLSQETELKKSLSRNSSTHSSSPVLSLKLPETIPNYNKVASPTVNLTQGMQSHDYHVTVDPNESLPEDKFDNEEWNEIINDDDVDIPGSTLSAGFEFSAKTGSHSAGPSVYNPSSCSSGFSDSYSTGPPTVIKPVPFAGSSASSSNSSSIGPPTVIKPVPFAGPSASSCNSSSIGPPTVIRPVPFTRPSASSNSTGPSPIQKQSSAITRDNSSEFSSTYPHTPTLMNIFKGVFGLRQFRPKQQEAINAAVLGKDCFILMPTGGGKSLCYQLPALVVTGVTVVVSPLRSLIQDQVQKLFSLEIPAGHLSGDMTQSEETRVYTELSRREPGIKLVYMTPEKLVASPKLMSTLKALFSRQKLARFVIDEAHCISSWGHDFRPDYKRLRELRTRFPGVPLMALTATATPRVQADILNQLSMRNTKWFTQSFNRINLVYSVVPKKPKKVVQDIIELIQSKFRNQSGIIYCLSRRNCELVSADLNSAGIPSVAYHAGLMDEERSAVQQRWVRDANCKVVCATIAFGMGIDKPDVRFVIHHTLAKSVEGYYQESGRAGRDGRPAHCVLYYNYGDMSRLRRLLMSEDNKTNLRQNMDNLFRMVQFCENESDCRRLQLLEYFAEEFDNNECKNSSTPCDNCQSRVPHSTQEVTNLVKTIIQSILRVPHSDQYTLVQHLEALRGTNSTRPFLQTLPYNGKGLVLSKHDLERLLHMMVLKGILAEDLQVGTHGNVLSYVKAGPEASKVLDGSASTILLKVKAKSGSTGAGNVMGPSTEEEKLREECYQELKVLRSRIAQEMGKNPEVVIAITTLQDMAQKLPRDKNEMLSVQGMTEAKWKHSRVEEFLGITLKHSNKMATLAQQVSPFFNGEGSSSSKENNCPRMFKKQKPTETQRTRKRKAPLQTKIDLTNNDSEDEFDTSVKKKATRNNKQARLPGFLSYPNK